MTYLRTDKKDPISKEGMICRREKRKFWKNVFGRQERRERGERVVTNTIGKKYIRCSFLIYPPLSDAENFSFI